MLSIDARMHHVLIVELKTHVYLYSVYIRTSDSYVYFVLIHNFPFRSFLLNHSSMKRKFIASEPINFRLFSPLAFKNEFSLYSNSYVFEAVEFIHSVGCAIQNSVPSITICLSRYTYNIIFFFLPFSAEYYIYHFYSWRHVIWTLGL